MIRGVCAMALIVGLVACVALVEGSLRGGWGGWGDLSATREPFLLPSVLKSLAGHLSPNSRFTEMTFGPHDEACLKPLQTDFTYTDACVHLTSTEFAVYSCENSILTTTVYSSHPCTPRNVLHSTSTYLSPGETPRYEAMRVATSGAVQYSACMYRGHRHTPSNTTANCTRTLATHTDNNCTSSNESKSTIVPVLPDVNNCTDDGTLLQVFSGGFYDGSSGGIFINGEPILAAGRGWNFAAFDRRSLKIKATMSVDLINFPDDVFMIPPFIHALNDGDLLVAAVIDDGFKNLDADVVAGLASSFGASFIHRLRYRSSYILVSRKAEAADVCVLDDVGYYKRAFCGSRDGLN